MELGLLTFIFGISIFLLIFGIVMRIRNKIYNITNKYKAIDKFLSFLIVLSVPLTCFVMAVILITEDNIDPQPYGAPVLAAMLGISIIWAIAVLIVRWIIFNLCKFQYLKIISLTLSIISLCLWLFLGNISGPFFTSLFPITTLIIYIVYYSKNKTINKY